MNIPIEQINLFGDFNSDSTITIMDLLILKKNILNMEVLDIYADFNLDNSTNILDIVSLKQYIFQN